MTLGEFKRKIEALPTDAEFNYSISEPFSWRGSYNEVAFAIIHEPSTALQILDRINAAYLREFTGYKGGEYTYHDNTDVHFEEDVSSYSDGRYAERWIAKIQCLETADSSEERLVNLLFK